MFLAASWVGWTESLQPITLALTSISRASIKRLSSPRPPGNRCPSSRTAHAPTHKPSRDYSSAVPFQGSRRPAAVSHGVRAHFGTVCRDHSRLTETWFYDWNHDKMQRMHWFDGAAVCALARYSSIVVFCFSFGDSVVEIQQLQTNRATPCLVANVL